MIEFRVLGSIEFGGIGRGDVEAVLSHPRWIAILARLLLAESEGGSPRDDLAALLWPSADRSRRLSSLRVALHGMRRHLGHETIVSRGDALCVDPDRLSCDALEFEEHLSRRRLGQALEAYVGDLLPGLSVRGAPRCESWLADRRESLRRRAADAAWSLCGSAERSGQWIGAVQFARRAVALSDDSEAAVRRLLRLLDQAGDGASAIREYEKHAERWRRELGVEPSAATAAVVETIRTGREVHPADRLRVDRWPDASRIAVLPFVIEGEDPSLEHLAAGMACDIIGSLARFSGVQVVARPAGERSIGAVGRGPAEIGRQLEANLVLDTSVRIVGHQLLLVARMIDVHLERPIWAEVYEAERSDLLEIRRRLLRDILAVAGVDLSRVETERLRQGHTASPVAFEHYLEGHSRLSRRTGDEIEVAMSRFESALAADPGFALAHAGLMNAHALQHPALGRRLSETVPLARRSARAALALDPELGEAHATLGFMRGFVDYDWDGAIVDLRRAIEFSPGHASAHHWLGAILSFVRREFDEGAQELEVAGQLDPFSPAIRADAALARANRGDLEGADRILRGLVTAEPGFWRAPYFLAFTTFLAGDPDSGTRYLRRAWRLGAWGAEPETDDPEVAGGADWREHLERRLARLESSLLQPGMRAVEAALLCMVLGRRSDALRWIRLVPEHGSAAWIMGYFPLFEPLLDEAQFREFLCEVGAGALVARRGARSPRRTGGA